MEPIRTEYKGKEFKSRLEANVAYWLDGLGIQWQYEPRSFLLDELDGTHYQPDFLCPKIKLWIEAKGKLKQKDMEVLIAFFKYINRENWITLKRGEEIPEHEGRDKGYSVLLVLPRLQAILDFALPFIGYVGSHDSVIIKFRKELEEEIFNTSEGYCPKCKTVFFRHYLSLYSCPSCGLHEGDHLMRGRLRKNFDEYKRAWQE